MELPYAYVYFVRHIIPGPQSLSYLIPHILLPIALLTPRSVLSRWQNIALFMPMMVGCTIHAWTVMDSVDVPSLNGLFWSAFLLVLHDPWTKFRLLRPNVDAKSKILDYKEQDGHFKSHQSQTTKPQYATIPYPPTLGARIPWTFKLMSNLTLDNWLISYQPHDKRQPALPQPRTRASFVLHTTFHALLAYIVLDLTCAFTTTDPYFTNPSVSLSSPLPRSSTKPTTLPVQLLTHLPPRILRPFLISLQSYFLISSLFPCPTILPALFLPAPYSPHTWPPYFGSPTSFLERGLSGWWGGYWHQTMRWSVSGPGIALSNYLSLKQGGLARRAVVLVSAFGLSGWVHVGLVPPEPLHLSNGRSLLAVRLCVGGFFWAQVLGILVEDVARRVVGRVVNKELREGKIWWRVRAVGNVVWLCVWFCLCMPLLGEAGRQLGWWRHWLVPVSLVKGVRGEGWVAWEYLMR